MRGNRVILVACFGSLPREEAILLADPTNL